MITITIKQLEENLDYYLEQSSKEDVLVLENGEKITLLTNPKAYASLKKKPL